MTPDPHPEPPPLCEDHEPVIAANRKAISGHLRKKTNDHIRAQYARQCPQCATLARHPTNPRPGRPADA